MINTNFKTFTPPQVRQNKQSQVGFGMAFYRGENKEKIDRSLRNFDSEPENLFKMTLLAGTVLGGGGIAATIAGPLGGIVTASTIHRGMAKAASKVPVTPIIQPVLYVADGIEDAGIAVKDWWDKL